MKKILSAAIVFVMILSCFAMTALADENGLPFELVAPAHVSADLAGGDSPTTIRIVYSLSNEMTSFFRKKAEAAENGTTEEFLKDYDFTDINITTQVDWAVDDVEDSVSGWHCNEFWNKTKDFGLGYDNEGRIRVGEWDGVDLWVGNAAETVNDHWVLRYVSEDAYNGNPEEGRPGLKDQLRAGQYTYDPEEGIRIDFNEHTVYLRMRFVVTTYKDTEEGTEETVYYSDFSNIASVGKEAEKYEPLTASDLPAPVITDLHMTDKTFNDNPVVAFTLSLPDELAKKASKVSAAGGYLYFETEARVKGDEEWTVMGNTDRDLTAGEHECALLHLVNDERPVITKDTEIELRCRYLCGQPELDDIVSEYSNVLTFGTAEIGSDTTPADTTPVTDGETEAPETEPVKDECGICHFCPRPLGICIFIWIAIIVVVIIVIVVVIKVMKKKKDKK